MDKKFISIRSQYYKLTQALGLIAHIERKFKINKNVLPEDQIEFPNINGTLDYLSDEEIINLMNELHSNNDEISEKDKKKKRNKFILDKEDIKFENINDINIAKNFKKYSKLAEEQYKKKMKRGMQKNSNLYIEFVVNFSQEYFFTKFPAEKDEIIKDIENLIKDIEKKYKLKGLGYSLHLDEGYKRKDGTIIYNPHFHLSFLNFDFETGTMPWAKINRGEFSKFQDIAFDNFKNLGFERGISKEITKATNKTKEQIIFEKINELENNVKNFENIEIELIKKIDELKNNEANTQNNLNKKQNNLNNIDIFLNRVIAGEFTKEQIQNLKKENGKSDKIIHTALSYAFRYLNNLDDEKKKADNLITLQNKLNELNDEQSKKLIELSSLDEKIEIKTVSVSNLEELENKLNETIKSKKEAAKNLEEYLLNEKKNAEKILNEIKNEILKNEKINKEADIILKDKKDEYDNIDRITNLDIIPEKINDILKNEINNSKNIIGLFNEDKFLSNTNKKIVDVVKSVKKGEDNPLIEKIDELKKENKKQKSQINELEAEIKPLRRLERINSNNVNLNTQNDTLRAEIISKNQIIQEKDNELKEIKSFLNEINQYFTNEFINKIKNIVPESIKSIFKPKKNTNNNLNDDLELKY